MKKGMIWHTLVLLIVVGVIANGCGKSVSTASKSTNKSMSKSTTVTDQSQPSSSDSINDLINKGKQIQSISFNYIVTTSDGKTNNGTMWWQNGKMLKIETIINSIQNEMLINLTDNTLTTYQPAKKQGTKISDKVINQNISKSPDDYLNGINTGTMKDLGTSVINGEACHIIQYTDANEPTITRKMALSEDIGYPVQITSTTAAGLTTKVDYTNIKVGALPNDIFSVPVGVTIRDLTSKK